MDIGGLLGGEFASSRGILSGGRKKVLRDPLQTVVECDAQETDMDVSFAKVAALSRGAKIAIAARLISRLRYLLRNLRGANEVEQYLQKAATDWVYVRSQYLKILDVFGAWGAFSSPGEEAGDAAHHAVNSVVLLLMGHNAPGDRNANVSLHKAIAQALSAAEQSTDPSFHRLLWNAIEWDIGLALSLGTAEAWGQDTLVPPSVFGKLWPGEVPPLAFGDLVNENGELKLRLEVPDDATDDEVAAFVSDAAAAMDELHRAYGGRGLELKDIQIFNQVPCTEGVTS
jgi:hypothetical protein